MKPIVTDAYDFPALIRNGSVHPGTRALSSEMAIGDLRSRDHGRVVVAERLLDVWLEAIGRAYAELPVRNLESQHWPRKISNFLMRRFCGHR